MLPESGLGLSGSGLDSAFSRYLEEGDTHDFMIQYTPAHTDWFFFSLSRRSFNFVYWVLKITEVHRQFFFFFFLYYIHPLTTLR